MILTVLLDLMRLRSGPQDLPSSRGLLIILAIIYVAQGFWAGQVINEPDAAPRTFVAIAVQFTIIITLLRLKSQGARVQQTLTAMAGTGFLFGLLSIGVLSQLQPGTEQAQHQALH